MLWKLEYGHYTLSPSLMATAAISDGTISWKLINMAQSMTAQSVMAPEKEVLMNLDSDDRVAEKSKLLCTLFTA